jgi:hypothetical protein
VLKWEAVEALAEAWRQMGIRLGLVIGWWKRRMRIP